MSSRDYKVFQSDLPYRGNTKTFVAAREKTEAVDRETRLSGYFVVVTSDRKVIKKQCMTIVAGNCLRQNGDILGLEKTDNYGRTHRTSISNTYNSFDIIYLWHI